MRRGTAWLLTVAIVAALGSAVAAIALVSRVVGSHDPVAVVGQYFDALERADAAAALGFAQTPVTGPYLTDQVLRAQQRLAPISGVRVDALIEVGPGRKRADLQYRLSFANGELPVHDSVLLVRHGGRWRLASVAAEVSLPATGAPERLRLAGAALPARATLFPGALPVDADWLGIGVTNRPAVSLSSTQVPVRAAVIDAGVRQVDTALRSALLSCLSRPEVRCPLPNRSQAAGGRPIPGSLRGTVLSSTPAAVSVGAGGVLAAAATARVQATYSAWDFDNIAQSRDGVVDLRLSATLSVGDLSTVYWQDVG